MNKLEDIVPPIELCKRIPAGAFEDSALVWLYWAKDESSFGNVVPRILKDQFSSILPGLGAVLKAEVPAPTLAEIRRELRNLSVNVIDGVITVSCRINPEDTIFETARDDNDVTAAALRLWLRVRREDGR